MNCKYCGESSATEACQKCARKLMANACYICGATGNVQEILGRDLCPKCYKTFEQAIEMFFKAVRR